MGSAMYNNSSYSQNALPHSLIKSYAPHGKYAGVDGSSVPIPHTGLVVSESCRATVRLRKDRLGGKEITYISKFAFDGPLLYRELYMYSHAELLRPLQGACVSYLIGVSEPHEGRVAVAMEPPHPVGWKEADAYEPDVVKNAIIHAYQTLHARGILHGRVQHEHVLRANDERIVLLDFSNAATVADHAVAGIRRCDRADLDKEMELVKTLVGYVGEASTSGGAGPMELIGDGIHGRYFEIPEDRRSAPWEDPSSSVQDVPEPPNTAAQNLPTNLSGTPLPVAHGPERPSSPPSPEPALLQPPSTPLVIASSSIDRERTPALKSAMAKPLHQPSAAHLANNKANKWVDKRGHARVAFHPDTQDNSLWTAPGLYAHGQRAFLRAQEGAAALAANISTAKPAALAPARMASTSSSSAPLTYREPAPYRQPDEPRPTGPSAAEKARSAPEEDLSVRIVITAPTGEECVWGVSKEVSHTIQKLLTGTQGGKRLPRGAESAALKRKPDDAGHDSSSSKKLCPESNPTDASAAAVMAPPSAGPSAPRKRKAGDAPENDENGAVSRAEEKASKRAFLSSPLQRTVPVS